MDFKNAAKENDNNGQISYSCDYKGPALNGDHILLQYTNMWWQKHHEKYVRLSDTCSRVITEHLGGITNHICDNQILICIFTPF